MRTITVLLAVAAAVASAKNLSLVELPPAVQKTVQEQAKGAAIRSISKETEHGVVQYEVETMFNGKHRDFEVDTKGNLLVMEEETTLNAIPPAARAAIGKKVADGKLTLVEVMTKGGQTLYEASYTTRSGRKREVVVKPDGTETKD